MDEEFFKRYEKSVIKKEGIPDFKMNRPVGIRYDGPGDVGIELELEAVNYLPTEGHLDGIAGKETSAVWRGIRDGSLRGQSMEYVLSRPCLVTEVDDLVNGLYSAISRHKTKLSNSNRCSTHVHVNMTGATVNIVTSVLILWGVFEPFVIDWCGEERKTNHFCLSYKDSQSNVEAWERFLRTGINDFSRNLKYSALNFLPLYDKGSIEFRCGRAADTADFPIAFAKFLYSFVDYVKKNYQIPSRIANDLSEKGGLSILTDIGMPAELAVDVVAKYTEQEFNDLCIQNFRVVQPLSLGFPWERWQELIGKAFVPDPFASEKKSRGIGLGDGPIPRAVPVRDEELHEIINRAEAQIRTQRATLPPLRMNPTPTFR